MAAAAARPHRLLTALAILALALAAVAGAFQLFGGLGARWGWWHYSMGFQGLRWSVWFGIGAAVAGVLTVLGAAWRRQWRLLGLGLIAVVVGVGLVSVPLAMRATARGVPPIHDLTTDTEDPPAFVAVVPLRAGSSNPAEYDGPQVAAQQRAYYTQLGPGRYAEPPERAYAAARQAATAMGWEIVADVPAEGRLEATATTRWFGFKDDVVVRVRAEGGGSRVDVRSKSRVGRSDLGANAKRIQAFLERVRAAGLTPRT